MEYQKLKIALAMAILKQKPNNVSAKDFTKVVCSKFVTSQKDLKERCQELELQVIHLKQDLVSQNNQIFPVAGTSSGVSTEESNSIVLTPSCHLPSKCIDVPQNTTYKNDVLILQTLHKLRSLASNLDVGNTDTREKAHGVLCQAIANVRTAVLKNNISYATLLNTIICTGNLLKENIYFSVISDKIVALLSELFDTLCSHILCQTSSHVKPAQLVEIGSEISLIPVITETALNLVLDHTNHVADHLRSVTNIGTHLNNSLFINSFDILQLLDNITSNEVCQQLLVTDMNVRVRERIELCSLEVTDSFPLFAFRLWSIAQKLVFESKP